MTQGAFLNIVSILAVFICVLLAAFLWTVQSKSRTSNRFFATFLVLTAIDLSNWSAYTIIDPFSIAGIFKNNLSALQMPVFIGYMVSACYTDFHLKPWHFLLTIPFIVMNITLLPLAYSDPVALAQSFVNADYLSAFGMIEISSHVLYYTYMAAIIIVLRRFRDLSMEYYAADQSLTFTWLSQLTAVSLLAHTLALVKNTARFNDAEGLFPLFQVAVAVSVLTILVWTALKALYQPELFHGIDGTLVRTRKLVAGRAKETSDPKQLSPENLNQEKQAQIAAIKQYMKTAEPFLDDTLTLNSLAQQLSMQPRELSVLINHDIGVHFFDFVNAYRIEKAKLMLSETGTPKKTILEILYSVGFNSKSSFNTAFKKHTHVTPTQFRAKSRV